MRDDQHGTSAADGATVRYDVGATPRDFALLARREPETPFER
jgi:hypothetical protein